MRFNDILFVSRKNELCHNYNGTRFILLCIEIEIKKETILMRRAMYVLREIEEHSFNHCRGGKSKKYEGRTESHEQQFFVK